MTNVPTPPPASFSESKSPAVSADELKSLASKLVDGPSLLDGITEPVDLERVKYKLFLQILPSLATLADALGYGWVAGVNGKSTGDDYIWVATGSQGGSSYHQFTGPGFAPNLNGPITGEMADKRCSIEFTDVELTYSKPTFENSRSLDTTIENLNNFEVENASGLTPTTTTFTVMYYKTGQVSTATQKTWQDSWNFSASATETVSMGGGFFPGFSMSLTEQGGVSGSTGGSQSNTNEITQGQQTTITSTVTTPAFTNAVYAAQVSTGKDAIDFKTDVTLSFGVKFHGFLRWGGGKPFQGSTNYHHDYTGSGDRPTVPFTFGGKGEPFWVAIARQTAMDSYPWAWKELFANRPDVKAVVDSFSTTFPQLSTFPVRGVMAGIARSDYKFNTISMTVPQTDAPSANNQGTTSTNPTLAGASSTSTPISTSKPVSAPADSDATSDQSSTPTASDTTNDQSSTPTASEAVSSQTPTSVDSEATSDQAPTTADSEVTNDPTTTSVDNKVVNDPASTTADDSQATSDPKVASSPASTPADSETTSDQTDQTAL